MSKFIIICSICQQEFTLFDDHDKGNVQAYAQFEDVLDVINMHERESHKLKYESGRDK